MVVSLHLLSLVVQWLGLHLPMKGVHVLPLVWQADSLPLSHLEAMPVYTASIKNPKKFRETQGWIWGEQHDQRGLRSSASFPHTPTSGITSTVCS